MKEKYINKRKDKRYAVSDSVFVKCRSRNGRVINISEGGMAINFSYRKESLTKELKFAFHCLTHHKRIDDLSLNVVRKENINLPRFGGSATQTLAVKFNSPDTSQLKQIKAYISNLS